MDDEDDKARRTARARRRWRERLGAFASLYCFSPSVGDTTLGNARPPCGLTPRGNAQPRCEPVQLARVRRHSFGPPRRRLRSTHLTFTIMSLLRACQQAVSKQAVGRAALVSSRAYSTPIAPDATIPQTTEQQDKEIAQAPQRDVVTADIVSGAPSECQAISITTKTQNEPPLQRSCVTAPSVSSSPHAAPRRVALASPTAGGLTGTFSRVVVVGRIRSWAGQVRESTAAQYSAAHDSEY